MTCVERVFNNLNMRSASDLTARARIRDAALARFGAEGIAGTSVRAVAADAGVSPALVLHHFGSKHHVASLGESERWRLRAMVSLDRVAVATAVEGNTAYHSAQDVPAVVDAAQLGRTGDVLWAWLSSRAR